ncbi:MAG: DUF134 domain-containing protein [Calditrichaeota bacterium]|nr:DUF134 domain-containing protein [Calditrichota bacterium]
MIWQPPRIKNFKPGGTPRRVLKSLVLTVDEYEAVRLADYLGLEHQEAAERMGISRPTFTRLIERARHKVANALVEGMELIIEGGNVDFINTICHCKDCGEKSVQPFEKETEQCPDCGSENVENVARQYLERGRRRGGR